MTSTSLSSSAGNRTLGALILEDLRRYWVVAFVAGLGYLLVTILPILLNYNSFDTVADYILLTVNGGNPLVLTVDVVLAVVASVCLLGYLHRTDACIAIHTMPAGRTRLMGASMVSGVLLMLIPLLVTAVLLMFCQGAKMSPDAAKEAAATGVGLAVNGTDIIKASACGGFLVRNLVVCFFTFMVSCLAGVLAGTKAIHTLTALFFSTLPQLVIGMSYLYMSTFLKGFPDNENRMLQLMERTSPVLYSATQDPALGSAVAGYGGFVLAGIVIGALTMLIYRLVRLEREGDATVFPLMGDILCMAVSFVCMSGFAFLASALTGQENFNRLFLMYAAVSGVVSFLIFRMVADSTTRIFNLKNLLKFVIYVALVALVFTFTVFDKTGYGNTVPETAEVGSATLWQEELLSEPAVFTEPDQIEVLRSMQETAIADKTNGDDTLTNASLVYTLKDGEKIVREYDLGDAELAALTPIQHTKPFIKALQFRLSGSGKDLKVNGKYPAISLESDTGTIKDDYVDVKAKDIPAVIKAMNKDMTKIDLKNLVRPETDGQYCALYVHLYDDPKHEEGDQNPRSFCIDKHWPQTVKMLKQKKYLKK